jgi:hypothetical protein
MQLHRLARKQRFFAFAALRFIAQTLFGYAIDGVAIWAGDLN